MKIEKQVCTLEQSRKLFSLGIIQKSLFYFIQELTPRNSNLNYYGYPQESMPVNVLYGKKSNLNKIEHNVHISGGDNYCFEFSAFIGTELGAMIGKGTKAAELHWQWLLDCVNSGLSGTVAYNAVALAGHIITQLENGTLSAETCNKGLVE